MFIHAFVLIAVAGLAPSAPVPNLVESEFLESSVWNDGQAEIAFYRVERSTNQYGQPKPQSFLMGTYLVKHDFDLVRQSKARDGATHAVSSFKWAAFYEFESDNSYQYKRNFVVNARQSDLTPLKESYTSFDWCSNQYRELSFASDGRKAEFLMRSDDYGNAEASFDVRAGAYPKTLIPLLVRSLDFSQQKSHRFFLLEEDGSVVDVTATASGIDSLEIRAGRFDAERIDLVYGGEYRSIVSRAGSLKETYWRGTGEDRPLLLIDAPTYRVELVEHIRSPYWKENVYDRLSRVTTRP